VYGKEDSATIIDCCQLKMAFPPKSQEDAELLSKEIGFITEQTRSVSENRGLFAGNPGSTSTSVAQRALLLPQEIKALGQNAIIMLNEGMPPAIGKKILYYKHPVFKKRCALPPQQAPILDYNAAAQLPSTPATPQYGAVPEFGPGPSAAATAPVSRAAASPMPGSGDVDDIFNMAMKPVPDDNLGAASKSEVFSDSPAMDGVFAAPATEELPNVNQDLNPAQKETRPRITVPETYLDYDIPLDVIYAMILKHDAVPVSSDTLPLLQKADLRDLMQDLSDVDIPDAGAALSGIDMGTLASDFLASLSRAVQPQP
jgi:hypothetical protein